MEGIQPTHQSREQQADGIMNRFLNTLQEISNTIQRQAQENAIVRDSSNKVMQDVGNTLENLVKNSDKSSEASASPMINRSVDLAEFSGDRSLWPSWRIQAKGKALSSGTDAGVQFYAVFNKLKDNAVKNVTPWVTKNISEGTATYEGLLKELGRLYDDPAQEAKALSCLKTMKQQERESFASFYPKFEKELANAGGGSVPDQIKIMFLRGAISARFRNCLPKTKYYETYEEIVIDLQNAAATMANEDALVGRRKFYPTRPRASEPAYEPTPMDWVPTINNQRKVKDDTGNRPRAQWVAKEILKARRDANCCLRCGNSNHYQQNCHYRPPINPNRPVQNQQGSIVSVDQTLLRAEPEIQGLRGINVGRMSEMGEMSEMSISENE